MRTPLFALLFTIGLLVGCGEKPSRTKASPAGAPVAVQAQTVAAVEWPSTYEATGTVRAKTAAAISSKVMGYVRQVNFQVGDRVRAGQVLVELDSRDLDTQVRQAEAAHREAQDALAEVDGVIATSRANLELAQATFRRMDDLFRKKSISNQEYDEASSRLKVAQAGYEMATAKRAQVVAKGSQAAEAIQAATIMRDYTHIVTPFDGIVTEKRVEPGNLAAPGVPLATIEQQGLYRLEASVEESRTREIRTGESVSVALEALGRTLEARVSEIVPAVAAASRSYVVKIDLPSLSELRSGMFGRAIFPMGRRRVLVVPAGAVRQEGQLRSVLVVDGGAARTRMITLGESRQERREVLSGLSEGERIVFPVPVGLADGARVEVRP
jgi:multidrug efflux system membrane fusion protein